MHLSHRREHIIFLRCTYNVSKVTDEEVCDFQCLYPSFGPYVAVITLERARLTHRPNLEDLQSKAISMHETNIDFQHYSSSKTLQM